MNDFDTLFNLFVKAYIFKGEFQACQQPVQLALGEFCRIHNSCGDRLIIRNRFGNSSFCNAVYQFDIDGTLVNQWTDV